MPFTRDEFFRVFIDYNRDAGPAPVVLIAFAVIAVVTASRRTPAGNRVTSIVLAALFAWCGIVYQWMHLAQLTAAGRVFGALFLFGTAAFLVSAGRIEFMSGGRMRVALGLLFVAYSLLGYPLVAYAIGDRYPSMPVFGAPCPTTIFALGLLVTAKPPFPRLAGVAPVIWAAIASTVAFRFGVVEDLALPLAAVVLIGAGIPQLGSWLANANQ